MTDQELDNTAVNRYETIARNAYCDKTQTEDGTRYGIIEYIDIMRGETDPRTYYSNILMAMSSPNVLMYRELNPKLAWLFSLHCDRKLKEFPEKVKKIYKHKVDTIALFRYYSKKILTPGNVTGIAMGYGFESGVRLLEAYQKFKTKENRTFVNSASKS